MSIIVDNPISLEIEGKEIPVVQSYESIKKFLDEGKTVVHWEGGDSLHPVIKNMEYCKISPISIDDVKVGDCVFCRLDSKYFMVHRVNDIINHNVQGKWFKIGNTWDNTYGWTQDVYGIAEATDVFQQEHQRKKWYRKYAEKLSIF